MSTPKAPAKGLGHLMQVLPRSAREALVRGMKAFPPDPNVKSPQTEEERLEALEELARIARQNAGTSE